MSQTTRTCKKRPTSQFQKSTTAKADRKERVEAFHVKASNLNQTRFYVKCISIFFIYLFQAFFEAVSCLYLVKSLYVLDISCHSSYYTFEKYII